MSALCLLSLACGWTSGSVALEAATDAFKMPALWLMAFSAGAIIGGEGTVREAFCRMGYRILLLPVFIAVGSVAAGGAAGALLGVPAGASLAASSGFGWYSISAVLVGRMGPSEHAALCFIANLAREVVAFAAIPVLAKRAGEFEAIAPAGATAMDTALPIITRSAGTMAGVAGVITGFTLSLSVPILVSFFYSVF